MYAEAHQNAGPPDACLRQLRQFIDVGAKPDAHAWKFPASTVNAWYDNGGNALYIPAGMMQKPFFSSSYPAAQNFGAIGSVSPGEGFRCGCRLRSKRQRRDALAVSAALLCPRSLSGRVPSPTRCHHVRPCVMAWLQVGRVWHLAGLSPQSTCAHIGAHAHAHTARLR